MCSLRILIRLSFGIIYNYHPWVNSGQLIIVCPSIKKPIITPIANSNENPTIIGTPIAFNPSAILSFPPILLVEIASHPYLANIKPAPTNAIVRNVLNTLCNCFTNSQNELLSAAFAVPHTIIAAITHAQKNDRFFVQCFVILTTLVFCIFSPFIACTKKRWFFGARLISLYAIYHTAFTRFWQYVFLLIYRNQFPAIVACGTNPTCRATAWYGHGIFGVLFGVYVYAIHCGFTNPTQRQTPVVGCMTEPRITFPRAVANIRCTRTGIVRICRCDVAQTSESYTMVSYYSPFFSVVDK